MFKRVSTDLDAQWIDLDSGIAGVYLSQLLPTGDEKAV